MRVLEENISLVIAGAWNPGILNPKWIAEIAMGRQVGENFQVQVDMPVVNMGFAVVRPRFAFEGICVSADTSAVTFKLPYDDNAAIALSINTAASILQHLSHTPVSGFGFNFGFEFADPSQQLLETFSGTAFLPESVADDDAQLVQQSWTGVIKDGGRLMNVSATLEAGRVVFDFNVHTEARTAEAAMNALRADNLFAQIKTEVESVIERFIPAEVAAL